MWLLPMCGKVIESSGPDRSTRRKTYHVERSLQRRTDWDCLPSPLHVSSERASQRRGKKKAEGLADLHLFMPCDRCQSVPLELLYTANSHFLANQLLVMDSDEPMDAHMPYTLISNLDTRYIQHNQSCLTF